MAKTQSLPTTGNDLQSLRFSNLRALLTGIWNFAPVSRYDLARLTGLAPSSISRLVQELTTSGLVVESGKGESSGGRQPILIMPNPDAGLVISLDLSGAGLRAGVFDAANNPLSIFAEPFGSMGPEALYQQIADVVLRLVASTSNHQRRLLGIGISLPGSVDRETGVVRSSYYLKLADFPMRELLAQRFNLPVYIEHDASVAALAEQYYGAGRNHNHFVYVLVSTGIGSGIVLDGAIYRGQTGMAGEFGHIIVNPVGQMCVCGRRGCLEAEAAVPAMVASARRILDHDLILSDIVAGHAERVSVETIAASARQGDDYTRGIIGAAAERIAQGISIYASLLDVHRFIIGGEVMGLGDVFFDPLRRAMDIFRRRELEIVLTPGELEKDAYLRGVSMLTLQEVLTSGLPGFGQGGPG